MQNKWKVLYYTLYALLGVGMVTWLLLLGTLCHGPAEPNYVTNQIIETNCHGKIVFIRPVQNFLLYGLIPALFVIGFVANLVKKKSNPN